MRSTSYLSFEHKCTAHYFYFLKDCKPYSSGIYFKPSLNFLTEISEQVFTPVIYKPAKSIYGKHTITLTLFQANFRGLARANSTTMDITSQNILC